MSALAFAVFEPIQVLPRIRPAPGYALVDQEGATVTSEDARGTVTLYTFAPLDCGPTCDELNETMIEVAARVEAGVDLGSVPFRRVTIVLDDDPTVEQVAQAAADQASGADDWHWLTSDPDTIRVVVGTGFRRFYEQVATPSTGESLRFDPSFVLVDGNGVIRGEYRYQTLASDADKLVHHIEILADEAANATGATAVAYEAAHLFLCYP